MPVEGRGVYLRAIMDEIFADKWVKEICLSALQHARDDGRPFEPGKGIISGKSFLPCLRQLYLLANAPFEDSGINEVVIKDLSRDSGYGPAEKLKQYYIKYSGRRLPQPFIRSILSYTVKLSSGTVDNLIRTLVVMEMARPMPCDFDAQAKAIEITEGLLLLVENWTDRKRMQQGAE